MTKNYIRYIAVNALSEFRYEYSASVFSLLWVFLQPICLIAIYAFVFSTLMKARINGLGTDYAYTLFLCSGILPWTIFTNSLVAGSTAVVDNAIYIKKLALPLSVFVTKTVVRISINVLFYLGLLVFFAVFIAGHPASWYWLMIPVPIILLQGLVLGLAMGLAGLNVFFRDITHFLPLMQQFLMWTVPVVYPLNILPDKYQLLLVYNPLHSYFHAVRTLFLYNTLFTLQELCIMLAYSATAIICGHLLLHKLRVEIRDSL